MGLRTSSLLAAAILALPLPAAAQSASAARPVPATQTFKAWVLDCLVPKSGEGAGKRVCFIHHEVRSEGNANLIAARVVVRHAGPQSKLTLIIQLPPNSVQMSGISATVDSDKPHFVGIQACLPKFCYGAIDMTPDLETEVKIGLQMMLKFSAKGLGPQQVPVPLSGITAALAALAKTGS